MTFCRGCGGSHEPDSPDCWMDFESGLDRVLRRFRPPFLCLCCGKEICARQFAFGRCCGYCDTGHCQLGLVVAPGVDEKIRDMHPLAPGDMEAIYETGHGRQKVLLELGERISSIKARK